MTTVSRRRFLIASLTALATSAFKPNRATAGILDRLLGTPGRETPPLSPYAWVLWSYRWEIRREGAYTLLVRATDTRGVLQDAESRVSFPDGDSGLHTVRVEVTRYRPS